MFECRKIYHQKNVVNNSGSRQLNTHDVAPNGIHLGCVCMLCRDILYAGIHKLCYSYKCAPETSCITCSHLLFDINWVIVQLIDFLKNRPTNATTTFYAIG